MVQPHNECLRSVINYCDLVYNYIDDVMIAALHLNTSEIFTPLPVCMNVCMCIYGRPIQMTFF